MYPCSKGVQLTRALGRGAWGFSLSRVLRARKGSAMAEQPPAFQFDDIPLDEARRVGRGPRMEPMLYDTLRHVTLLRLSCSRDTQTIRAL
jgi:hypothetical protein